MPKYGAASDADNWPAARLEHATAALKGKARCCSRDQAMASMGNPHEGLTKYGTASAEYPWPVPRSKDATTAGLWLGLSTRLWPIKERQGPA